MDRNYHGLASISYDFVLKFIEKGDLVPFTREQQEKWKSCLMGGIVEVLDLNLKQETVHKYDINGLYSHVRLKDDFDYPIGEPELIVNPSVDRLRDLFGLIKATVYNDGSVPIGIPAKDGASFNRYKGSVFYQGTTEELKSLIRQGAKLESILEVLHYSRRKSGKELFGKALAVFDRIKSEGEREGNIGKRTFGKILHNSSYGGTSLDWLAYGLLRHDKSNLTIGIFITSYARMVSMSVVERIHSEGGKVFYTDTDSFDTNIRLPDSMIGSEMGKLKYEAFFDRSIYLGRKQYYLLNTSTGLVKVGCKGYDSSLLNLADWERAFKGDEILLKFWQFKKEDFEEIKKIDVEKIFKKSLNGRIYREDGTSEPIELKVAVNKRINNSLSDTELDDCTIRVGGYRNSNQAKVGQKEL